MPQSRMLSDDAGDEFTDAGLPLVGGGVLGRAAGGCVHGAVQIFGGDDVGRGHGPVDRHFDFLLLEDDLALGVGDRCGATLPLDFAVGRDAGFGEAAGDLEAWGFGRSWAGGASVRGGGGAGFGDGNGCGLLGGLGHGDSLKIENDGQPCLVFRGEGKGGRGGCCVVRGAVFLMASAGERQGSIRGLQV